MLKDTEWQEQALCAQVDPELFHPSVGDNTHKRAKSVCNRCPVKPDCLSWGLENPDVTGILGGLDTAERTRLRKRMKQGKQ